MRLRYNKEDGEQVEIDLTERPLTIGRSPDADIILRDEKISRMHCGIRLLEGEYYVKDLQSKNGTFLNGERIDTAKLKAGDVIRVGSIVITYGQEGGPGADTALREIKGEMELGKGYSTILREIVDDVPSRILKTSEAPREAAPPAKSKPKPVRTTVKKQKK